MNNIVGWAMEKWGGLLKAMGYRITSFGSLITINGADLEYRGSARRDGVILR